jgi:nitronate monooxygenase
MQTLKSKKDPAGITTLFNIQYPILQGPMGGGFSTAGLLAAVSNAGGLGSFGAYTFSPEQIRETDKEIKALTNKPYNINLWVSDVDEGLKTLTKEKMTAIQRLFQPYYTEAGIPFPDLATDIPSKFEKQVEVILDLRPAVFSFIFGIPSKEILKECRQRNIKTHHPG